jgi:hypothetical protein
VLNVIPHINEDIKERLLEDLINIAVSGSIAEIGIVHNVLHSMRLDYIKSKAYDIIIKNLNKYLKADTIEDIYMFIASFFIRFDMKAQLHLFLNEYCKDKNSTILDEIYDDYINAECYNARVSKS